MDESNGLGNSPGNIRFLLNEREFENSNCIEVSCAAEVGARKDSTKKISVKDILLRMRNRIDEEINSRV